MPAIQMLASQPWVERLGWTLVHFLWQGALIAALYAIVRVYAFVATECAIRVGLRCAGSDDRRAAYDVEPERRLGIIGSARAFGRSIWSRRFCHSAGGFHVGQYSRAAIRRNPPMGSSHLARGRDGILGASGGRMDRGRADESCAGQTGAA
jgi:hypothetical protein